ncbi:hypothetical protein PFICI_01131 [Pestalotiopsis fici W106-1]|uniref:Uncharacterized protein n=1 Tax=Pestalotiopsis fici (strain W106-1 / CGMCC3.15140) TaxID=1229662 RepID=W3XMN5_PESFW|nr:uncharacterized protein PFICI_01131 [Pestalotiopsis fici W106-1]ETS87303.1 hypothetical protein PFICI_01131 [Pestalotiopsis fici W106-1]
MDSHNSNGVLAASPPIRGRPRQESLGSLYEVLADLDENQLHYLIQEMNHTGHQNVKVSQAKAAFESQSPTESLQDIRASMLPPGSPPPEPGLQRRLSKSQQGKLRIQTAFQRAPSLRQRQVPENRVVAPESNSRTSRDFTPETPKRQSFQSPAEARLSLSRSPTSPVFSGFESRGPVAGSIQLPKRDTPRETTQLDAPRDTKRDSSGSSISSLAPTIGRKTSAYKRIPRPDFDLPPGVTVTDLLRLLESEFLSSADPLDAPSPMYLPSPSSAISRGHSPSPLLLSASTSSATMPFSTSPTFPGGHHLLRRPSSRLDMALDAERNASGFEEIGLGMLEPRATPSMASSVGPMPISSSAPVTPFTRGGAGGFMAETPPPQPQSASPMVLEGIFDVLENR